MSEFFPRARKADGERVRPHMERRGDILHGIAVVISSHKGNARLPVEAVEEGIQKAHELLCGELRFGAARGGQALFEFGEGERIPLPLARIYVSDLFARKVAHDLGDVREEGVGPVGRNAPPNAEIGVGEDLLRIGKGTGDVEGDPPAYPAVFFFQRGEGELVACKEKLYDAFVIHG